MAAQQRIYNFAFLLSFYLTAVSCLHLITQPDDILYGQYDNLNHNDTNLCTRTCIQGAPPKICYYKFNLEMYTVLGGACKNCPQTRSDCDNEQCVTADGFQKPILTINRKLPGPSIQVCTGDLIVVDIVNKMKARSVAIHWHGIHQKKTPFMDGVPMVTQCPISEGQEFRYKFLAQRAGSYFYHSHSGLQKVDGISGSLIIRDPKNLDAHQNLYDFDLPSHVVVIQDWMHTSGDDRQPSIISRPGQKADSYLINGKGVYSTSVWEALTLKTPITEFKVRQGSKYRFRLIGSTCLSCSLEFAVESHPLTVIASDERDLEPVTFDKIVLASGERYDVVINADKKPRTYWITVQANGECSKGAYQIAALTYVSNTASFDPSNVAVHPIFPLSSINPNAVVLNNQAINCTNIEPNGRCINKMRSRERTPKALLKVKPDLRLTYTFNFFLYNTTTLFSSFPHQPFFVPDTGDHIIGMMNNVSLMMSPSPLLTQKSDIPKNIFCTKECQNTKHACECLNVIKVNLGSVVEIVIADMDFFPLSHPFHLHGHSFHVVTQGKWGPDWNATLQDLYRQLNSGVLLHDRLPVKDSIPVPAMGYTVFRVLFDNPGYWLLHCHFLYHIENGMSSIIQVGEDYHCPTAPQGCWLLHCHFLYHVENGMSSIIQVGEDRHFPKIPKDFPRCGNFLPDI